MSGPVTQRAIRRHLRRGGALVGVALALVFVLAGEAAAQEFVTQPYGTSSVSVDERGTLIDVPSPPGGLYYRATVDPTKTYRITVHGEQLGGRFALRFREDMNAPKWVSAPHGTEVYRFSGASTIELLFYRGSNAEAQSYRVRGLSIEDCSQTCQTDADLKAKIVSETPGLSEALDKGDAYGAATMLLEWTATTLRWADVREYVLSTYSKTAAEIYYDNFLTGQRGVFCGGAADFFTKILTLFDVPSFRLDYGDRAWFTHSTAVVALRAADGKPIYRILDPTFGTDYRIAATGRPLSVPEIFELWRAGLTDRMGSRAVNLAARRTVRDFDGDGDVETRSCGEDGFHSTGCGIEPFRQAWRSIFLDNGYSTDDAGLIKFLAMEPLLNPSSLGVPEDFQEMHRVFQDAVRNDSQNVHVAKIPLAPEVQTGAVIHGPTELGATLSANRGTWKFDPTTFEFSWARCDTDGSCTAIPGATGQSYTVTGSDARHRIELSVIARNQYGHSEVRVRTTDPVPVPPDPVPVPPDPVPVSPNPVPAPPDPASGSAIAPSRTPTARFSTRAYLVRRGVRLRITNLSATVLRGRVRIAVSHRGRRTILFRRISLPARASRVVTIRLSRAARERLRGRRTSRGLVAWQPLDRRSPGARRPIMLVRAG